MSQSTERSEKAAVAYRRGEVFELRDADGVF
jgi:hypothetical protein